jgi:FdhE protein
VTTWDRRIERAEEMAREYPAAAEALRFYVRIAELQKVGAPREEFERLVGDVDLDPRPSGSGGASCPECSAAPFLAVLRPAAEGGARSLLCSACYNEWPFNRLLCPACGEQDYAKLPVYTAEQFPHIRIDACDACKTYVKAIDLTLNGLAVPEVDDIASIALDLWAKEQGYVRLQPNVLGI